VSRLGGDEFVLLLEALSPHRLQAAEQARRVVRKMLVALQKPFNLRGQLLTCTASLGVVLFSGSAQLADALLKCADSAMYQAKNAGGNQIFFHDPVLQAAYLAWVPEPLLLSHHSECMCHTGCATPHSSPKQAQSP
jgi:predicted signal transduction protein with EAL and GGDEF domain